MKLEHLVSKLRPAPLATFVAAACGLSRRRFVSTDHGTFLINPISVFGSAILRGGYEPQMTRVLERYLKPGGTFIDLGANEGYFSVVASKLVGRTGTVIAIEPQRRLQAVLHSNFIANECFNVRLLACAVADKTGTMQLSLAPEMNTGSSSLFRQARYPLATQTIPTFGLGELVEKLGVQRCDLMKVDIEGAEYDVFMSSAAVLRSGILQNMAVEHHASIINSRGLSPDAVHTHILDNGYQLDTKLGNWVYSFHTRSCSVQSNTA